MDLQRRRVGRRVASLGILFVLPGLAGAASPTTSQDNALLKAARVVRKADSALKLGNFRKAEQHYQKALELVPDLPEGHVGRGHVLMSHGRFEEAHEAFLAAAAAYRDETASLLQLQLDHYDRAQVAAAQTRRRLTVLRSNAEAIEDAVEESGGRGHQREQARRLHEEIRAMEEEATRLESMTPPPHTEDSVPGMVDFFLGNALSNLGRLDEAVTSWERCAVKIPDFPIVHYNLAVAYWQLDRLDAAEASLRISEELGFEVNPDFRRALNESRQGGSRPSRSQSAETD